MFRIRSSSISQALSRVSSSNPHNRRVRNWVPLPRTAFTNSKRSEEPLKKKSIANWLAERTPKLLVGAHDGMTGRLGERAGLDGIWASGFEISASYGLPDANILDMTAQLHASCQINDDVSIP